MLGWLKRKVVGKAVAGNRKDAMTGKLGDGAKYAWNLIDGWKAFIVGGIAVYKLVVPNGPGTAYIDAVVRALQWDTVQAAFDPASVASVIVVLGPFVHKIYKAYRERQAGVPVEMLSKSVIDMPPAVAIAAVQATAADTLKTAVVAEEKATAVVADAKAAVELAPTPASTPIYFEKEKKP